VSAEPGSAGAVLLGSLPGPAAVVERTDGRRIVLQSLARAWPARDLGRLDEVRLAVAASMATVRRMMAELLQAAETLHGGAGRGLRPGELAHLRATRSERHERYVVEDLHRPVTEPDGRGS
jgi:hypothetical protein